MKNIYINFDDESQMCPFDCGAKWGNERFIPGCYGCMLAYGFNYDLEQINNTMPHLEGEWKKIMQAKNATETRLKDAEAELHKTNAALKSTENENELLKIELAKFKLKAGLAEIDMVKAKTHALDLEMHIANLEIENYKLKGSQTEIDMLKAGLVNVVEPEVQFEQRGKFMFFE